jgi:hypothetical protein
MSSPPTAFPELLAIAARDGQGGLNAEPRAIVRGEALGLRWNIPADEEYGDWTGGDFEAGLFAAPVWSDTPLAEYAATTGTPAGGLTPVDFALAADALASDPVTNTQTQLTEVFFLIAFIPTGGQRKTLVTTRQMVRG